MQRGRGFASEDLLLVSLCVAAQPLFLVPSSPPSWDLPSRPALAQPLPASPEPQGPAKPDKLKERHRTGEVRVCRSPDNNTCVAVSISINVVYLRLSAKHAQQEVGNIVKEQVVSSLQSLCSFCTCMPKPWGPCLAFNDCATVTTG